MIYIIDFGSQTTHLICRRMGELGIEAKIILPKGALQKIKLFRPKGIIFSGGPSSVYEKNAPTINKKIFDLNIPILGICYGQQLITHLLNGEVEPGKIKEYGPALISQTSNTNNKTSIIFNNIPNKFRVWMSHGDSVIKPPKGFQYIAKTEDIVAGVIANEDKKIFGVQFHPEVQHTEHGMEILRNFLNICKANPVTQRINISSIISNIKEIVKNKKVIMAFSGGTDSFVAAALIAKAIGKNLIPVYVESGLMRNQALINVTRIFPKIFGFQPKIIRAESIFLKKLNKIIDPERKRKIIGKLYIDLFEKEAKKYSNVSFLAQGTTYADFIHSKSTRHAALIKSHHNVGGLPKKMRFKLLEPIRYFYTDQVRYIGKQIGLPNQVIFQQPFPGPGFAVRIIGKINSERLIKIKQADNIVIEEMERAGLKDKIFQYFAILTGANSTAIKGDGRFYGEVVAIRAYTTKDRMTADWAKIPYPTLQKISARIVNEVPNISRVVYDITTKPPATMEWE